VKACALTLAVLAACLAPAQIKTKLKPTEAMRLRKGELVRYFKTRPSEVENGLPYQVLLVVTPERCVVKTNKWEWEMTLNEKQKQSLKEDLDYLDYAHLNNYKHDKGTPEEERTRLYMYLQARKGKRIIRWNSKVYEPRGAVLLIEKLEVWHYFAKQEMEKK
jgi:hypothetical protein